ncbi:hypothetical protein [Pontibacillus sp. HMF3514]|uniref:hypothetical protein n=1 Tax=Pontibacillus sp. HMF3514 TaxID=2692425 RepID=UPI00131FE53F|nr:hypothetical protein [Pontibacillus sp. HMF3514]QHE50979.1 hypothetical protein GS400_02515 [Pontibacillus sp. HMF3514]
MNVKHALFYLGWTIGIGVLLFQGGLLLYRMKYNSMMTYEHLPYLIAFTLFPIILGISLRIPSIWLRRNNTKWGFDWVKFVFVGVPAAYVTFSMIWALTPLNQYPPLIHSGFLNQDIPTLAGVVLGYILLDSLRVPKE